MRVFFIDPGKDSGWFVVDTLMPPLECFSGGELPHDDFLTWMNPDSFRDDSPLLKWGLDRVVCEGFDITEETGRMVSLSTDKPLWSIEQIGCLRFWCHRQRIAFEIQSRTAKSFDKKGDKLKRLGWYKPMPGVTGEEGHRRDAARHAVKWCADHHVIDGKVFL